jgi:Uma2 family endonuclease
VDQFHGLSGLSILEDRKVILVDGEILDMPPANHPHDLGIGLGHIALAAIFGNAAFWIRIQMALPLGRFTDPIPDIAVVAGPMRAHVSQPTTALLIVEVSDSSLAYDMGDKSNLYASGGIADYWVLDLNNRELHIFRDPIADATAPFGFRYQTQQVLSSADSATPLAAPQASIRVADLLP